MNWRYFLLIPAMGPLLFYCLAIYAGLKYFWSLRKLPPHDREFAPPVSILKPVRGLDREAYENFESFCALDYRQCEILFVIADKHDPAVPIVQKLQQAHPQQAIRLIVGIEQIGITRKTN